MKAPNYTSDVLRAAELLMQTDALIVAAGAGIGVDSDPVAPWEFRRAKRSP